MLEVIEPHVGVKYMYEYNKLVAKVMIQKLMTIQKVPIEEFWKQKEKRKIVDQLIKATFILGGKKDIKGKSDFEHFKEITTELANDREVSFDVMLDLEPDFDLEKNKITVEKVRYGIGTGEGPMLRATWGMK
jgi:hypothetical protein